MPIYVIVSNSVRRISLSAVELETRIQAFAIEREATALAAAEAAASIRVLQAAAAAAATQVAQQKIELQETKATL